MDHVRILLLIAVIQFTVTLPRQAQGQAELLGMQNKVSVYPWDVSHRAGTPHKPLIERPGDRNVSSNPNPRYLQSDSIRSGCPKSLSQWAIPSLNAKYSAGYAGGSTYVNSPHSRPRNRQEGTWGLDFTLWGQPKSAWLRWSDGSRRQSNGNFETDR